MKAKPKCETLREWMSLDLDGMLDPDRTKTLREHVAQCSACAREREDLRRTVRALRSLPKMDPPADLAASIRAQIREQNPCEAPAPLRFLTSYRTKLALAATLALVAGIFGMMQFMVPDTPLARLVDVPKPEEVLPALPERSGFRERSAALAPKREELPGARREFVPSAPAESEAPAPPAPPPLPPAPPPQPDAAPAPSRRARERPDGLAADLMEMDEGARPGRAFARTPQTAPPAPRIKVLVTGAERDAVAKIVAEFRAEKPPVPAAAERESMAESSKEHVEVGSDQTPGKRPDFLLHISADRYLDLLARLLEAGTVAPASVPTGAETAQRLARQARIGDDLAIYLYLDPQATPLSPEP